MNPGKPDGDHTIKKGEKRFNYGFNDFVVVECTPEYAYQVHGVAEKQADLPPKHPRAWMRRTNMPTGNLIADAIGGTAFTKHKSGYTTMAYGWGNHADVLDSTCETNHYVDVEGPEPPGMYGDVFVKFIPLVIPGGLAKNDLFWIDLNKGVRALYFPARYKYHKDFPEDAGYAKISFVEGGASRKLIDASGLIFENTIGKTLADNPIELEGITRETAETIGLNKEYHVGAYSFDSTLIVNVPKFIAASYYVAGGADRKDNPHDALYLAKSVDINAKRLPDPGHWILPPLVYDWRIHTQHLMRSYAKELGRMDEANLEEVSNSDLGASEEFFLSVLMNAASLIPYVGPVLSILGAEGIEALKGLRKDSDAAEVDAAGISNKIWGALPGEAKDKLGPKIAEGVTKALKYVRRR